MKQYNILKQYNLIKINPSPEIWLKSMKVRMRMVKTLTNNIKQSLKRSGITYHKFQLSKDSTRIFFFFGNEDIQKAMDLLEKVFGIDSFSPALRTSQNLKNIVQRTLEICEDILDKNDTFAIRVKRSGMHDYTSQDVAKKVGQAVLDTFSGLNLKSPSSVAEKKSPSCSKNQYTFFTLFFVRKPLLFSCHMLDS